MLQLTDPRKCSACGKHLKGRSDKRFCDDFCRNGYNNHLKSAANNLVRNINHTLGKNRRILEGLLPATEETVRSTREKLQRLGFNFQYITNTYTNKTGKTYFYCYDYGYLPLDNDWLLIVRKRDE